MKFHPTKANEFLYCFSILFAIFSVKNEKRLLSVKTHKAIVSIGKSNDC